MPLEFIQQNLIWFIFALGSGFMLLWPGFRQAGKSLSPMLATQLINRENAILIDVRETAEFAAAHIAGSRNIPLKELDARAEELAGDKEKPLLFICASGIRAGQACSRLKKQGFGNLNTLEGGFDAWQRAGLPCTRGNKKK
ncbi:MAG: rhodanese-like domain-containing protein [Zoogloeaceae bacterium]|nr:rhodanese-like domain-containing protein [Zoogloeaceae bacterium]